MLLIGGQAADAYRSVLDEIGAVWLGDLADLRKQLEFLRMRKPLVPQVL
jgi:hypothetical protein